MYYYALTKDELCINAKIPVSVLSSTDELAQSMANDVFRLIKTKYAEKKKCVIIMPVGPVCQYPYLIDIFNKEKLSLHDVYIINMDEYLKSDLSYIDISDKLSFRRFMRDNFYSKISQDLVMPENQRIFPDPAYPGQIPDLIKDLGGVDGCFGGIGITGHIAFNEPEDISTDEYREKKTRIVKLSPETRTTNAINELSGALEIMPEYAVTVGMKEILSSRMIRLYCLRPWHRSVVRRASHGDITARFPVTLLQEHSDVTITINDIAAGPVI